MCRTSMLSIRDKLLSNPCLMAQCWQANFRRTSTSWSSHGLKYTKRTCLLTGTSRLTAGNPFLFEGWTNENCKGLSDKRLHASN